MDYQNENNSNLKEKKCSHIALIGSPNAGKSTLLNNLIGSKISIISPKVQTTRNMINGICIYDNAQLIFIDTPGIFTPSGKLEKAIVKVAWRGVSDAEQIALLIDSKKGIDKNTQNIIDALVTKNLKACLILNKIDLVKRTQLLLLAEELSKYENFTNIFMISALTGEGVEDLKKHFRDNADISEWLYPEDEITTLPKRFFATELVREQLFLNLDQELPYNLAVECEKWEEFDNGEVKINLVIYITRDSQKKIIIGKAGSMIKKIGQTAREELEEMLEQKVHLFIFIKVRENWLDNPDLLPTY
ncbi:MAG: GTPase Era [Alphaproteobacteria bacterium]